MVRVLIAAAGLLLLASCTLRHYEMPITVTNGIVDKVERVKEDGVTVIKVPPSANNGNQLTLFFIISAEVPKNIQAEAEARLDSSLLPVP